MSGARRSRGGSASASAAGATRGRRAEGDAAVDVTFPTLRGSFGRGFVTMMANPSLVVGVPVALLVLWLALIGVGFQGPVVVLVHALAFPPVGTLWDVNVSLNLFASPWLGLVTLAVAIVFRAVVVAVVAAIAVRTLRGERVDRWIWVPTLRALPASLAVSVASLGVVYAQALLGAVLGGAIGGISQLLLIGTLLFGVSYFGFAPAIAVTEDRRLVDTLTRAWRVARSPGSGNLTVAALYVLPSYALLLSAPALPGGLVGVNPSAGAWVLIVLVNLVHVAVMATYAYRYLAVADAVADVPVGRTAGRKAGRSAGPGQAAPRPRR